MSENGARRWRRTLRALGGRRRRRGWRACARSFTCLPACWRVTASPLTYSLPLAALERSAEKLQHSRSS